MSLDINLLGDYAGQLLVVKEGNKNYSWEMVKGNLLLEIYGQDASQISFTGILRGKSLWYSYVK